ncbi:MAG: VWA domain-containing protein, partial [Bacillota bacterium]|nr:VWA domain-containing protein [Bacillota bacterium]
MGLSFTAPLILLLIPVLLGGIIYSSKWLGRMLKPKRNLLIILRSLICIFLILSYCGTTFYWKVKNVTTFFLIDASDSTLSERLNMEAFVREAYNHKGAKDKIGVLSFGDNAQVENFVSSDTRFSKVEGKINGNYTNIENALAAALSLFPNNSNKRIVLLSDGEENEGSAGRIAASLQQQGVEFKYYKIKDTQKDEALVESISVPQKLTLGEEFNIYVNINSTVDTQATLHLYNGRTKVGEQKVQVSKGENKFVFRDKAVDGGIKDFKVVMEADKDSELKNNEASAFTNVEAKPRVLVIQDNGGEADELIKMLKASSLDYTLVNSKGAPSTLAEMNTYKSIITCNVSADNLNEGFLNNLESYVKDFGGGFIATGGTDSFALGGYSNTPLEKVLPVYMDMRGKKETPKMAMVLIIDKSGSMTEGMAGISKVDMAKEAAIRSLDSLRVNKDEIGVLSFDGAYSWVVKRQLINDVKTIEDDIGTIRADGGTSILPALQEGYNSLKESDAKIKHIILLTDGQAEQTGYDSLLKSMNDDNITVSTVAVGKDADVKLLESIANACGGRHYVTDEYTNIPRIFSKETFMAARTYLNNREFTPVISSDHSILSGAAEGGLPSLLGYVGASQKETARVILKSDEEDPILTVWQYGLGKTAAWNSDISGKWSANYVTWSKDLKLWQNIINFTVGSFDNDSASMDVSVQGSKATISYTDKKNEKETDTSAVISAPSGQTEEIKLYPTAPGKYSATIDLKESGTYMINGKQTSGGEILNSINTGYSMQYSPEYKISTGSDVMDKLVADMGGKVITSPEEVFKTMSPIKGQRDLTPFLLTAALLLFMLDVALRRLNINFSRLKELISRIPRPSKAKKSRKGKYVFRETGKQQLQSVNTYEVPVGIEVPLQTVHKVKAPEEDKKDEEKAETIKDNANMLDTSQLLKNKKFKK